MKNRNPRSNKYKNKKKSWLAQNPDKSYPEN
jgi:hypothetical protein